MTTHITLDPNVICKSIFEHVQRDTLTLVQLERRVASDLGGTPAQVRRRFTAMLNMLCDLRIIRWRYPLGCYAEVYEVVPGATYP